MGNAAKFPLTGSSAPRPSACCGRNDVVKMTTRPWCSRSYPAIPYSYPTVGIFIALKHFRGSSWRTAMEMVPLDGSCHTTFYQVH